MRTTCGHLQTPYRQERVVLMNKSHFVFLATSVGYVG